MDEMNRSRMRSNTIVMNKQKAQLQRDYQAITQKEMNPLFLENQNKLVDNEFVLIEDTSEQQIEADTLKINHLLDNANELHLTAAQRTDLKIRRNRNLDFQLVNDQSTWKDSDEMKLVKNDIRTYEKLLYQSSKTDEGRQQMIFDAMSHCLQAISRCDTYLNKGKSFFFWRQGRHDLVAAAKERYQKDYETFLTLFEASDVMKKGFRENDRLIDLMNVDAVNERVTERVLQEAREAEEAERQAEQARLQREAEEQQRQEEERLRKEAEEREALDNQAQGVNDLFTNAEKQQQEEERLRREAEERQRQEAEEHQRQEEERLRKEAEEARRAEQQRQEQQHHQEEQQQEQVLKFGQRELDAMMQADTAEIQAVRSAITNIQTEMNKPMPPISWTGDAALDKKAERHIRKTALDEFCVNMVMLFAKLYQSIKKCLEGNGYGENPELKGMLEHLQKQTKMDRATFRDKVLTYRSWLAEDEARATEQHTWCDAWKYVRSESYDLDNNKDLKIKKEGAGASDIIVIEDTKKKETVYFRKEENAGGWDAETFIESVMQTVQAEIECKDQVKTALRNLFETIFTQEIAQEGDECQKLSYRTQPFRNGNPIKQITDFAKTNMCTNEISTILAQATDETKAAMGKALSVFAKKIFQRSFSFNDAEIDFEDNLTVRNVATSRLAQFLKIGPMVSDSRTAVIKKGDQHITGNVMEESRGEEMKKNKTYTYSNKAISQSFTLQVFDLICGQIDRHQGNFHIITKKNEDGTEEIKSLKAIDNDMAFGNLKWENIVRGHASTHMALFTESHIRAMPIALINRILLLKQEYLDELLGDILDSCYIEAMMDRLKGMQTAINDYAKKPGSGFIIENGVAKFTGEDADDTLRMLKATKAYKEDLDNNDGKVTMLDGKKVQPETEYASSLIQWKSLTLKDLDERIQARRMGGKIG